MPKGVSAAEFAKAIDNYANKTVTLIAKDVAGQIFTELATTVLQTTPVLTGHARHNWVPTVDTPSEGEIDGVAGVEQTGDDLTADEASAIDQAVDQFKQGSGTRLNFTNNVPYIQNLDQGSSTKAPAGIVEPSIDATLAYFKDKKLKLSNS